MRSLNCADEQRPRRYHGNKSLVTSTVEDEMKPYPLPRVQLSLPRDTISVLPWVQDWPGFGNCLGNLPREVAGTIWWCPLGRLALTSVSDLHTTGCQAQSWFVNRSQPEFAKLILLDCPPLKSLNNCSGKRKKWGGFDWDCKVVSLSFELQIRSWGTEFMWKLN